MKKRKIKLLASLTSLVLVVAVMAVGVWAATNATVNFTNTVDFTAAKNVKATITYSTTLENATSATWQKQTDEVVATLVGNEQETEGTHTLPTVALGDFSDFVAVSVAAGNNIVYTYSVKFQNTASLTDQYKTLIVTPGATFPTEVAEMTPTARYQVAITGLTEGALEVTQGTSGTITFTLTIDPNYTIGNAIDLSSSFVLTME